jgi:hypothetical protein
VGGDGGDEAAARAGNTVMRPGPDRPSAVVRRGGRWW